jgi:mannan endo-1,4-beta-mannosidase
VVNQWPGGFQGSVRVTAGGAAITGWTVTWTFANGQTITSAWNTAVTGNGSSVTARNLSYNGAVNAGASTEFGFTASWNNSANSAPPTACAAT